MAEPTATTARVEAENWAKSQFLAKMSLELRTPQNAIIGFAELDQAMKVADDATEQGLAVLGGLESSGQRLAPLAFGDRHDGLGLPPLAVDRQVLEPFSASMALPP